MTNRQKSVLAVVMLTWLGSAPAWADTTALPKVQTQGEASFVSGGIGDDELAAMHEARRDYNLQLLFAAKGSGEYLSSVAVVVKNAHGDTVLDTVADGPLLYAKLPRGQYQVSARYQEQVQNRKVRLGGGATSLSFYW